LANIGLVDFKINGLKGIVKKKLKETQAKHTARCAAAERAKLQLVINTHSKVANTTERKILLNSIHKYSVLTSNDCAHH